MSLVTGGCADISPGGGGTARRLRQDVNKERSRTRRTAATAEEALEECHGVLILSAPVILASAGEVMARVETFVHYCLSSRDDFVNVCLIVSAHTSLTWVALVKSCGSP